MNFWNFVPSGILYSNYYFEATLFIALITLPTLEKRKLFWLRATGSLAVICLLYWLFFWPLGGLGEIFSLFAYLILFVLYIIAIEISYKINITGAIFYGTMAHAIQNMCSHTYIILSMCCYLINWSYHPTEICSWITITMFGIGSHFFISKRIKNRDLNFKTWTQVLSVLILIVFSIVLNMLYDYSGVSEFSKREINNYILFHSALIAADLILVLYQFSCYRYSSQEKDDIIMNKVHSLEKRQMKETKALMDAISIKSHDLKHQLMNDSVINEYKQEAMEQIALYDSFANTGNESLDVVLTQKKLYCQENGIDLHFLADGSKLDFLKPADLYSLLGNLLDNAIEAVKKLEPNKRSILLKISQKDNKIVIHIENEHEGTIKFVNGIPETTKKDKNSHGYGVRSIRNVVEKYGGIMSVNDGDSVYSTDIVFNQDQT